MERTTSASGANQGGSLPEELPKRVKIYRDRIPGEKKTAIRWGEERPADPDRILPVGCPFCEPTTRADPLSPLATSPQSIR